MQEDFIKTELMKYNVSDAKIAEMRAKYLPLKVVSIDDIENYMVCKEAHQQMKKLRVAIEVKRKELKASSLEFGRAVDTEAKRLTASVSEVENHLLTQRKVVEDEKKRIQEEIERKEKEEQERLRREEEERLETIRREQEEKEKKLRDDQEKLNRERQAVEEQKAKNLREQERQEREKREAEEARKRAEQAEKDRVEREKRHAEEVERAKKEAAERAVREEKARAEQQAREKAEAEAKARAEAEEKAAMAPDKMKLEKLVATILTIKMPEMSTPKTKGILIKAVGMLNDVVAYIKKEIAK